MVEFKYANKNIPDFWQGTVDEYIKNYGEDIYYFFIDGISYEEDHEYYFGNFTSFDKYFSAIKEDYRDVIIEDCTDFIPMDNTQIMSECLLNAFNAFGITLKEVFEHGFNDDDNEWFESIIRKYYYDEAFEVAKPRLQKKFDRFHEED